MDTYSVYLVDDEPWALVYLEKIVKWEEMGFRITGKFENSVEAFNRAAAEPPDVIFIDIRMPELDGLAFMHKALEAKASLPLRGHQRVCGIRLCPGSDPDGSGI